LTITALTVALVTFALVFGGALLGMYFRNVLSEHHLREDVRDVIKLSTGLIGTMAALVLGLLIASAKSSYDAKSTEIKQITANIILLDLELEQYGPDAQNLRIVLRKAIPPLMDQIWSEGDRVRFSPFMATVEAAEFVNKLGLLQPNNDSQRALQAQLDASTLGGSRGLSPISRISMRIGSKVKPPPRMSHA
jgi:hypothetical protein